MAKNIAINGFGRIGKVFLRTVVSDTNAQKELNIVAINVGPSNTEHLAHFFKYDSALGTYQGNVSFTNNTLTVGNYKIKIFAETDPAKLPWKKLAIDFVVEASGMFVTKKAANAHIQAGSKKVLITAPATDEDITIIPGVNDTAYDATKHTIISLGSCTTNCFAPIIKVLKETFDFQQGCMTTVHSYTNNQALLDSEHKDPRRGRAAAINIVPTHTGAQNVILKIYPELTGKLQASALRVPVQLVSLIDFTFTAKEELDAQTINNAFKKAADGNLKNILHYETAPLVSSDFIGSTYSCIIDSQLTTAQGNMGKVFGWYDNEFGYSTRLKDFLLHN